MNWRFVMHALVVGAVLCSAASCANRGKLRSPSQIKVDEEKKARKAASAKHNVLDMENPLPEESGDDAGDSPDSAKPEESSAAPSPAKESQ